MMAISTFRGKKVALFGLGGSGMATAQALATGGAHVTVWDDASAAIVKARKAGFSARDLRELDWTEISVLILAPGVPLTHPEPHYSVKLAHAFSVPIIGDIDLFFRERAARAPQSPVIAITGTNGKSTTTALVAHLLRVAGFDVQMGGNIGTPVLELEPPAANEPKRVHVLELSSYQIDLSPDLAPTIGVHLNLSPDHLDRHGTMDHYASIKERLVAASDRAIIGIDDAFSEAMALRRTHQGRPVATISVIDRHGASIHVRGRHVIGSHGNLLADLSGIGSLRGDHNGQNAAAAIAAVMQLGVEASVIQQGLQSFPGLAHRMEQIGRIGRALAINDSKATNADSTEKALLAFPDGIFWIAGGKAKAGGIKPLKPYFARIAKAYLIGDAAREFAETLDSATPHILSGTLAEAVKQAADDAREADFAEPVILLSPSCASFDQFPNFEVRGQVFRALVEAVPGFEPL
jgi:UDP-N-acetylmuramoylalanine--D-glutamate ligase